MRKSYHTLLITLYQTGRECLIAEEIRSQIPASTICGFRNRKPDHYFGGQLDSLQRDMVDSYALQLKHHNLKRTIKTIERVWIAFTHVEAFAMVKKKAMREFVVEQVQLLSRVIPRKRALKLFGISASSFRYALNTLKYKCDSSPFVLCRKRHPNQLSVPEVRTIQNLMADMAALSWPVISVYYHARRNEQLTRVSSETEPFDFRKFDKTGYENDHAYPCM